MAFDPTYRRRWTVTLARAGASIVGFSLADVFLFMSFVGFEYYDSPGDVGGVFADLAWPLLVPVVWAVVGGIWLDHALARRGPWWALIVHPLGLMIVAGLAVVAMASVALVREDTPVGFLGLLYVVPVPFIGVAGALLTWLIPASFPRTVQAPPRAPETWR